MDTNTLLYRIVVLGFALIAIIKISIAMYKIDKIYSFLDVYGTCEDLP